MLNNNIACFDKCLFVHVINYVGTYPRAFRQCMLNTSSYDAYWETDVTLVDCGRSEIPTVTELLDVSLFLTD